MALFNEILSGRFNRFVQKHFSMKGREGMQTLSADLGMTIGFRSGSENDYLQGWETFSAAMQTAAAGAGNALDFQIRNPVGSGVIAVCFYADLIENTPSSTTVFSFMAIDQVASDQNVLFASRGWDTRGRLLSTLIASVNSAAPVAVAAGTNLRFGGNPVAAAVTTYVPPFLEIPILPGSRLVIQTGGLNVNGISNFWWRERSLESSEVK